MAPLFASIGVVDADMSAKPLATQLSYEMKSTAVAGCNGGLALNPSLSALAQEGPTLEWGGMGGMGGEVVW